MSRRIEFAGFRLELADARLWAGSEERPLRGKSFAVLRYLAERPGRLVTRAELLRAVWPGAAVSPGVVRVSVAEVRQALGDEQARPRFIETVGRRGYRFRGGSDGVGDDSAPFVGRTAELELLRRHFRRCRAGRRQTVFVTGGPGIGKTTLLERFADEVRDDRLARVAFGQCTDANGASKPYLPLLDLLTTLSREDARGDVVAVLERCAPSWLGQLPGVLDVRAAERLRERTQATNRERLVRELAEAVNMLSTDRPLVLVAEDLHWSDASTIDVLSYLAERNAAGRVLIIGSYRPIEALISRPAVRAAAQALVARNRAVELALEPLSEDAVGAYLARRLPGAEIEPRLVAALHVQTDGNPLFLASVVEHALGTGALRTIDGRWRLAGERELVPQSVRALVAGQIDPLAAEERAALEAASVVGVGFDAATVAAACERPALEVDALFTRLAERGQQVCTVGTVTSGADIVGTYEFVHAMHHAVLYQRIAPAMRARLHQRVARHLEAQATTGHVAAATLASHFERAGDASTAVRYYTTAIDRARLRFADKEIVAHALALESLLEGLPTADRCEYQMIASMNLALATTAMHGFPTADSERHFERGLECARELQVPHVEMIARAGLWSTHLARGDQRRALEAAEALSAMARALLLPFFATLGHTAIGWSAYIVGECARAADHIRAARASWDPSFPAVQLDPRISFLGTGVLVHALRGDIATADAWAADLLAVADASDSVTNALTAYQSLCQYRMVRGDRPGALALAARVAEAATEYGFAMHEAGVKLARGWASRDPDELRAASDAIGALGVRMGEPARYLALADVHCESGRLDDAEAAVAAGLASAADTGERCQLAELHRRRAACARGRGRMDEADAALRVALDVGRTQGARLLVLRAAADLAEILIARGRLPDARAVLDALCEVTTDGAGEDAARVLALRTSLS